MPIQSMLTEAAISLATGASKVVLRELMDQSGNEDEKGSIIPYRSDGNKSILCLVHGFSGDAEKTFKPMPELITEDEDYPFKFATVAGESDEFVPPVSSLKPFPEKYHHYTNGNHTTMTKPVTAQDTSYLILKNHLADNTSIITGSDSDVSNLIARYHVEVNTLGSKLEQLDNRGFRNYIFALEGTNKLDQAIETIENSRLLSTNTDVMGILGGRYKRKYLQEGTQEFLDKAIEWYQKAMHLSVQNDNSSQIFYHAINLAFLHLMRDESDTKRYRELAEKALHHCELENGDNYWDDATRAEASLYLNDFVFISPKLDHPFRSKLNHPELPVKEGVKIGLIFG